MQKILVLLGHWERRVFREPLTWVHQHKRYLHLPVTGHNYGHTSHARNYDKVVGSIKNLDGNTSPVAGSSEVVSRPKFKYERHPRRQAHGFTPSAPGYGNETRSGEDAIKESF